MDSDLKKAFQKAVYYSESRLSENIWHLILAKENRRNKIRAWVYSITSVLSFAVLIPIGKNMFSKFSLNGFGEYISLLFSDSSIIVTYWKEFSLSLINSIPFVSFALSMTFLFVLFLSLRGAIIQFKNRLLIA